MRLAKTTFVSIAGAEVKVAVENAQQARLALKELRHKKREYGLIRRVLAHRAEAAARREATTKRRKAKPRGLLARLKGWIATLIAPYRWAQRLGARRDRASIERELEQAKTVLHNLDACIVQLEGRLLNLETRAS